MTVSNNGALLIVKLKYANNLVPQLFTSLLTNRYSLFQLQFHFSNVNNTGSEHIIDGMSYDIEAQLVFTNTKYTDADAFNQPDGIAIVSKFMTGMITGDYSTSLSDSWHFLLQYALKPGQSVTSPFPYVNSLGDLVGNLFFSFYSYAGSLTQPNCSENVSWFIGRLPARIPFPAIGKFRTLMAPTNTTIAPNFRPPQPLNGRTIQFNEVPYFR